MSELVLEVERQGTFFEKIAKFHENMEKMNDHEFGRAIKIVIYKFSPMGFVGEQRDAEGAGWVDRGSQIGKD